MVWYQIESLYRIRTGKSWIVASVLEITQELVINQGVPYSTDLMMGVVVKLKNPTKNNELLTLKFVYGKVKSKEMRRSQKNDHPLNANKRKSRYWCVAALVGVGFHLWGSSTNWENICWCIILCRLHALVSVSKMKWHSQGPVVIIWLFTVQLMYRHRLLWDRKRICFFPCSKSSHYESCHNNSQWVVYHKISNHKIWKFVS